MSEVDVIQVLVSVEEELEAAYADLRVSVKGSSLVTGNAALNKAREVAQLVSSLSAVGITQAEIHVENIYAEVSSGLLTKSSSATYMLKVRCSKLENLADVLGAITGAKAVELGSVEWGYPEDEAQRSAWFAACARKANERAKAIAEALGVKILGVHRFSDPELATARTWGPPGGGADYETLGAPPPARRRSMGSADLGLAIAHTKKVEVRALVEYRVSPLG